MNHCVLSDMVRGVRMLCPAWLLALAVLCAAASEVRAQCMEDARCRDLTTDENILVSYNIPCTHDYVAANVCSFSSILLINSETNIMIANCLGLGI